VSSIWTITGRYDHHEASTRLSRSMIREDFSTNGLEMTGEGGIGDLGQEKKMITQPLPEYLSDRVPNPP
jgi:hypothetical protein